MNTFLSFNINSNHLCVKMFFKLMLLFLSLTAANVQSLSYNGYRVYKLSNLNDEQSTLLASLENNQNVDFWTDIQKGMPTKVMVAPKFQKEFELLLKIKNINYSIALDNVEKMINDERNDQNRVSIKNKGDISFTKYHRYSEIQDYLYRLASEYSDLVSLENYGVSYEGRNLTGIYVSSGGNDTKPIIFVDAGIHAREWIAPAQALYIINQVLEIRENKHFLENVDWVFIPLLNPDGYEYTHIEDRLWRKTRSKGKTCDGVDPNRNFAYQWNGPGSSTSECSNTYAGPTPFSEPETLALSNLISKYSNRCKLYLSFHSAAQAFLYPWGYTTEAPKNEKDLRSLAEKSGKAISNVNGTRYAIGSSAAVLSYASGSSRDWAYGTAGISLAYTMELPAGGNNRFDMPPERILGVVQEMFEGVKVFHSHIENS